MPQPAWKTGGSGQLVRRSQAADLSTSLAAASLDEVEEIHLPVDVVIRVLELLGGDATSLCAAACVSSTWHAAAQSSSSLWRIISVGGHGSGSPSPLALRMDGNVLARLAGSSLTHLDLSGAMNLSDVDLLCLRLPASPSLEYVSMRLPYSGRPQAAWLAPLTKITARGVVAALKGRKLTMLEVEGMWNGATFPAMPGAAAMEIIAELRTLVCKPEFLDVRRVCGQCARLTTSHFHRCAECTTRVRRLGLEPEMWAAFMGPPDVPEVDRNVQFELLDGF